MRFPLLRSVVLGLLLVACGDYSNDDIAFLDALPTSSALKVAVPSTPATALTSDATLHGDTVVTAEGINADLTAVLDLIDQIQTVPPSQRTPTSRTWGPFDDRSHPGFEVEVALTKEATGGYDFAFSERKKNAGESFVPVITGTFFSPSAHLGHGSLHLDTSAEAQIGFDAGTPNLTSLDVEYANDVSPRTVTTTVVGTSASNGTPATTTYAFEEQPDASGKLVFDLQLDVAGDGGIEDLHLVSVWVADGAGRSDGEISGGLVSALLGDGGSDRIDECWSSQFAETYFDSELYRTADGGPVYPGLLCGLAEGHSHCPDGDAGACVLPSAWP